MIGFKLTKYDCLMEHDDPEKHCPTCDHEGCQDGRILECVNVYASTCDGCADLTNHEEMWMDEKTQLGYCHVCVERMKKNQIQLMCCLLRGVSDGRS